MGAAVAVRRTEAPPGHAVAPRGSRRSRDVVFAVSVALVAAGLFDAVVLRGTSGPICRVAWGIGIPLAVAAVVRCTRPMRRAGRAALGLTIGTAAVIAGAGVTIPPAGKAGPTVHGAVETLAVIGGVVLLVQAAVTALGGIRRRWLRLVAIPVGLVAVYYVIGPLTLAVYVTPPPHAVLADRTPADAGIAF